MASMVIAHVQVRSLPGEDKSELAKKLLLPKASLFRCDFPLCLIVYVVGLSIVKRFAD